MKKTNRRGFSLMELLAVMTIMGILATVAVTGYFSAIRSMTRRRAVSNFVATLQQARQRACIDGARMAVVCYPENAQGSQDANLYVVCKALGRVTYKDNGQIGDEFTPLDTVFGKAPTASETEGDYAFGSRRLYNLSSQNNVGVMQVEGNVKPGIVGVLRSGLTGAALSVSNLVWCFMPVGGGAAANFEIGDLYGVEASPVASLPKNIYFSSQVTLLFKPDGSASGGSVTLNDQAVKGQKKPIATISVDSTGGITGGDQVNLD